MKKIVSLTLVAVLLLTMCFALASCGSAKGEYTLKSLRLGDTTAEFKADDLVLELKDDGVATLKINHQQLASALGLKNGELISSTWEEEKIEGEKLVTVNVGLVPLVFTQDGDELSCDFMVGELVLSK